MTLQLQWADEDKSVLDFSFPREWTLHDLFAALRASRDYVDVSPHPVSVIVTFEGGVHLPRNFLQALPQIAQFASTQFELAVIVMQWRDVSLFYHLFRRIVPHVASRLRFCDTVERAYAIIAEHRAPPSDT